MTDCCVFACLGEKWLRILFPADDVLEKSFGDENSVKGMYNGNESDIDWQLEN